MHLFNAWKFSLTFRPYELLFHIQVERESDREQKTGCRVQSSYVAFVKSPVRCDFLVKIEGNKKNRYLKRVFNPYDSGENAIEICWLSTKDSFALSKVRTRNVLFPVKSCLI